MPYRIRHNNPLRYGDARRYRLRVGTGKILKASSRIHAQLLPLRQAFRKREEWEPPTAPVDSTVVFDGLGRTIKTFSQK